MRAIFTKPWFSKLTGWYCDTRLSRLHIPSFIKKYQINTKEIERPIKTFKNFNDFFTRKLKSSARPINQEPDSIIAPVDGCLYFVQDLTQTTQFTVKGKAFDLETFLKNKDLADYFYEGTLLIFYLSPADYHRFHFPFDTVAKEPISINGVFQSVNPLVYESNVQPLEENERHLILLSDKKNNKIGYIPVGALCVGRITETFLPEVSYKKGTEAGFFSFGGSTVVLLFPKNTIKMDSSIVPNTFTQVKMGIKIGTFIDPI